MLRRRIQTGSPTVISLGLPARYSGARIGLEPPTRGIVVWVAHLSVRAFVEPTVVMLCSPPGGTLERAPHQRAPRPFKFAFFNKLSYWWDIRCA